ncbi:MAG: hypothetical protein K9J30_09375 [Bacteroidales bacterium]|nr:hypothetical protein [Bacteroidales bacterium]
MKKVVTGSLIMLSYISLNAQISSSFELRYFSKDRSTQGHTDFKGEKEYFGTEQRIEFLNAYADAACRWFSDSALDRKVNTGKEIENFLEGFKPQPSPQKRNRIQLDQWKKTGAKGHAMSGKNKLYPAWDTLEGIAINNGNLYFLQPGISLKTVTDSIRWRFLLNWRAMSMYGKSPMVISLNMGNRNIIETGFHSNGNIFFSEKGNDRMGMIYETGKWYDFRLEADMVNHRYNLLVDGKKTGNWIPFAAADMIDNIKISGGDGVVLDHINGIYFDTTGCDRAHPYDFIPFINETFQPDNVSGNWYDEDFNDFSWETDQLPAVRGGVLEAGEDLLLRTKFSPGAFKKAWMNIETLDPGGEVWINGRIVFVTRERHPVKINITEFLVPHVQNTIAIRVFSYFNNGPLYHSSRDRNVGWFCGRTWIDFTEAVHIEKVKAFTSHTGKQAEQFHRIELKNNTDTTFTGSIRIDYNPWHPVEGSEKTASFNIPVTIFARDSVHLDHKGMINNPRLWTHDQPNLYRVHVKIMYNNVVIDDEVITTGIRTISQDSGTFRINNEPELLGGVQTMGFRMPVENNAKWNRCPPSYVLADELLACKKMGNALRIHVHSGGTYAYSINDPRIAEMADQLGLMVIWPTSSWIREGEWGGIDFEGYPQYMEQVFNHPSIVMWEGSNHPNRFAGKPLSYSNRFISKIYHTIHSTDSSRLISPSSYNRHFAYRNDEGTVDASGNTITACPEWTAPMIVRGNQDAITGYGANWHNIRNWPDPYRISFLASTERAYFNFEHEESIGMQNFSLAKGKPWYQMPSYENIYDTGSIGREFRFSEWKASQAWQAFSAWESMKWQRISDIDGFSWCCLHGGPNSGTYRKPLIDALGHAKLAFYTNKMALQDVIAGSDNTDVIFHTKDEIVPVVLNIGERKLIKLKVIVETSTGEVVDSREYNNVILEKGRTQKKLPSFRPDFAEEGYYTIKYYVLTP